MSQLRWLIPILFFMLVYIEVSVFVTVVNHIGVFLSLLAIMISSLVGVAIAHRQGMNNAQTLKQKLAMGEAPLAEVTKNFSFVIAGVLFLFPGFFTDIFAVILLIPFVQNQLVKRFIRHAKYGAKTTYSQQNGESSQQQITIEGEFAHKNDEEENSK